MKLEVVRPDALSAEDLARWHAFQEASPELWSPYLAPGFTRAAAAARSDVRVGVLRGAGGAVEGYFPFQCDRLGVGGAVGGRLSDCQAVVAAPGAAWDAAELVRGCGMRLWDFDHLVASQAAFEPHHRRVAPSPIVDLSAGFEAWERGRREAGSSRIRQLLRKARKLEREVGPLRFEAREASPRVLEQVFAWKSEQCRRTGVVDFFARPWTRALVRAVHESEGLHFAGMLSALYAGDRLLAAHLGMRSRHVLHWWFPVYDHAFAKYSPGGILLLRLAETAAAEGIRWIDLGKGDDAYKQSFASGAVLVAEGTVSVPSLAASLRRAREATLGFLRRSPLAAPLRSSLRGLRRARGRGRAAPSGR